ncbi:acyl transferase [Ferruginibacter yonginensis]|uniref:Acyl transferase n=1 Tax=Ferruginibacter yonginensis TaxID=1310416 RepID=A0ABV8QNP8_9BACT
MTIINETLLRNTVLHCNHQNFESVALAVFNFQYQHNTIYRTYCDLLKINPLNITTIDKIPFLPIQFFKTQQIKTTHFNEAIIFESSGTTGSVNSKHFVKDVALYIESFTKGLQHFYGNVDDVCIIGLLPSYLERQHSSLVYMVQHLIEQSNHPNSGFYLYDVEQLKSVLAVNEAAQQKTILIGVTYALIDFAEKHPMPLQHTIVMETGGMKGRKKELSRKEVHQILSTQLGLTHIHSEYGMTELLSQAYSKQEGIFDCPPWMRIVIRSEDDPFDITTNIAADTKPKIGGVNIIDLANLYSCAFIATDDVGRLHPHHQFEIIGRLYNSDIRGCGLMIL